MIYKIQWTSKVTGWLLTEWFNTYEEADNFKMNLELSGTIVRQIEEITV